jgi:hypothetical protein
VASDKPLLWRIFDAADRVVAPRLEEVVHSGTFLGGLGLVARVQARLRRAVDARTRAAWHLVNLPAGSDVARLRRELAALDREVRRLSTTLERAMAGQAPAEEDDDARDPRGAGNGSASRVRRAAGPRSPGRRAQRPSSP